MSATSISLMANGLAFIFSQTSARVAGRLPEALARITASYALIPHSILYVLTDPSLNLSGELTYCKKWKYVVARIDNRFTIMLVKSSTSFHKLYISHDLGEVYEYFAKGDFDDNVMDAIAPYCINRCRKNTVRQVEQVLKLCEAYASAIWSSLMRECRRHMVQFEAIGKI